MGTKITAKFICNKCEFGIVTRKITQFKNGYVSILISKCDYCKHEWGIKSIEDLKEVTDKIPTSDGDE